MPYGANFTICQDCMGSVGSYICWENQEGQGECSGMKSKIKHLEKQIPPSAAQRTINPSGALLQMIIPMPSSHPPVAKLPLKPCSPDIVLAQNVSNFAEITVMAILP